jgi:3-oxoacyl-[acyl-carrier protein] reductase
MSSRRPIALVTGGSRGIGAATARRLAADGWDLAINYRKAAAEAERVANEAEQAGARARCYAADVSVAEHVTAMFERVEAEMGVVTGLVCNAGMNHWNGLLEQTLEQWSQILAVDLTGPFLCTKAAVPAMLRAGGGSVVNVSSIAGITGGTVGPGYAAAKGGVIAMTRYLGRELTRQGVRVNAVAPIFTETEMIVDVPKETVDRITANYRLGRMVKADEVADVIAYLLGPRSSAITGEVITIGA